MQYLRNLVLVVLFCSIPVQPVLAQNYIGMDFNDALLNGKGFNASYGNGYHFNFGQYTPYSGGNRRGYGWNLSIFDMNLGGPMQVSAFTLDLFGASTYQNQLVIEVGLGAAFWSMNYFGAASNNSGVGIDTYFNFLYPINKQTMFRINSGNFNVDNQLHPGQYAYVTYIGLGFDYRF